MLNLATEGVKMTDRELEDVIADKLNWGPYPSPLFTSEIHHAWTIVRILTEKKYNFQLVRNGKIVMAKFWPKKQRPKTVAFSKSGKDAKAICLAAYKVLCDEN